MVHGPLSGDFALRWVWAPAALIYPCVLQVLPMAQQKPFSRTAQDLGSGTIGVSIPKSLAERCDVEAGDEIPLEASMEDGTITYFLD